MKKILKFLIPIIFLSIAAFVGYRLYQENLPDEKKILGTWYSVDRDELSTYKFNSDQTMTFISENLISGEQYYEIVFNYEMKSQFFTTLYEGDTEEDYTYSFDKGRLYIKAQTEYTQANTKILCRTVNKAKKYSETYRLGNEYAKSIADKNGFAVKNKILYAYLGDEKEVRTPKNVKEISFGAFSSDFGRGEKLTKVTVTGNVKKIDEQAFAFTAADVIVIEEGVEELGEACFMDSYIREIYFPSSIETIGNVIMETEEGLHDTVIHCVEGSKIAEYLKKNIPYGRLEIRYDYEDYFK